MKKLILLRHCQTVDSELHLNGSIRDAVLSKLGEENAKGLVQKLSKYQFDLIFVSTLQRTLQTITPYIESLKPKPLILVEPLTIERNLGIFTGTLENTDEIGASMKSSGVSKTSWIPPNGESTREVSKRAEQFLEMIKARSENSILICGHQNFLRCLELLLKGEPVDDKHYYSDSPARLTFGEIRKIELSPPSVLLFA
jgi:broad specificity phosphatase PhoE